MDRYSLCLYILSIRKGVRMKVAVEMYTTIISFVVGLMLLIQVFGLIVQIDTANEYSKKFMCQIEYENLSSEVINRCIVESEQLGYELRYQEFGKVIRGCSTCGYIFEEYDAVDMCVSCGSGDVHRSEMKYGEVKLIYNIVMPILGINRMSYIRTYVH